MAKASTTDKFANIAFLSVTESAANTLTFSQLQLANNLLSEKAAIIIHRAEFLLIPLVTIFNSSGDNLKIALTLTDRITDIGDLSQPEILFAEKFSRDDLGAAASGLYLRQPFIRDFTELPGGGIIVPADRLYIGAQGNGCAAAAYATMRLYYTVMPLQVTDYWELIEARRIMTT